MSKWRIENDNDTGPDDDGFWEWWNVTDGERTFRSDDEADAQWLLSRLALLSAAETQRSSRGSEPDDKAGIGGIPLSGEPDK